MTFERINAMVCRLVATVGLIGYVPLVPGTIASLLTVVAIFFIPLLHSPIGVLVYGMVLLFLFLVGVYCSANLERITKTVDPSFVVIDEVVGMAIALYGVPQSIALYLMAFCLFRFFDISKIFPICTVEQKLSGGWGMMLDDVVAGVFSLLIIQGFILINT